MINFLSAIMKLLGQQMRSIAKCSGVITYIFLTLKED